MSAQQTQHLPEKATIESLTRERGDALARLDPAEQATLDKQVRATQINMLYANLRTAFGGQMLGALLLALTMYTAFPLLTVVLWFSASAANQISRLFLLRLYNRARPTADDAPRWGNYWLIGAALSGVIWSSTIWLFFSADAPQQQVVLMSLLVSCLRRGGGHHLDASAELLRVPAAHPSAGHRTLCLGGRVPMTC
jgi:hypothetical protein